MFARHRAGAGLCLVVLLVLLPSAVLAQPVEPTEPPSAEELSFLQRLDAARATIARLQAASDRAEYERSEAERAVVEAHRELQKAAAALDLIGTVITDTTRSLQASERLHSTAQGLLDAEAATSYKFNGARGAALLFELMASTEDPNAFARDLYALESVMVRRQQEVARLRDDVAATMQRLETFTAIRGSAYLRHRLAEEAVEVAEQEAVDRRRDAATAEKQLLAAAEAALAIELEAALARIVVPPAPPGADIPAAGSVLEVEHPEAVPALPAVPVAPGAGTDPVGDVVEQAGVGIAAIDFAATREQVELRQTWLADRALDLQEEIDLDLAHRRAQPAMTCPVEGAAFSNDWHYPRSHGRRHKGIDMLADFGTPVVAMAAGTVTVVDRVDAFDGDNDLGGIALTYETDAGRFYASHLQAIPDDLEEGDTIAAGDVIGWVGDSGNAKGGPPHLHLGWYVGAAAVNPFPTVALVCTPLLTAAEVSLAVL